MEERPLERLLSKQEVASVATATNGSNPAVGTNFGQRSNLVTPRSRTSVDHQFQNKWLWHKINWHNIYLPNMYWSMKRHYTKYTKEMLEPIVKRSYSISDVLRFLNMIDNGGNRSTIKNKIQAFEIDTIHFIGKHHRKGQKAINRKQWQDILVKRKESESREDAYRLRRALLESGREYKCSICEMNPVWEQKELRFQVDHINKCKTDDRPENLRFLCPNCHSQTDGFCGSLGLTDVDNSNRYGYDYYYRKK